MPPPSAAPEPKNDEASVKPEETESAEPSFQMKGLSARATSHEWMHNPDSGKNLGRTFVFSDISQKCYSKHCEVRFFNVILKEQEHAEINLAINHNMVIKFATTHGDMKRIYVNEYRQDIKAQHVELKLWHVDLRPYNVDLKFTVKVNQHDDIHWHYALNVPQFCQLRQGQKYKEFHQVKEMNPYSVKAHTMCQLPLGFPSSIHACKELNEAECIDIDHERGYLTDKNLYEYEDMLAKTDPLNSNGTRYYEWANVKWMTKNEFAASKGDFSRIRNDKRKYNEKWSWGY